MKLTCISTAFAVATSFMMAAERRVASPDGKLALTVSDAGGLNCRVEVDGQPLLKPSRFFGPGSPALRDASPATEGA